ncbi:MAG TPA: hypothetical protein DD422_04345 [Akkermansia sp.]|nr:hypothetical protein [Akkermansia sp.]
MRLRILCRPGQGKHLLRALVDASCLWRFILFLKKSLNSARKFSISVRSSSRIDFPYRKHYHTLFP